MPKTISGLSKTYHSNIQLDALDSQLAPNTVSGRRLWGLQTPRLGDEAPLTGADEYTRD